MKVLIVFYSMYGHIYKMAQAMAEGAKEVPGAEVVLRRVPETLSDEVLGKMGALEAQKAMAGIPVCPSRSLAGADAIIFGTPTRFGNMCGQMRQFLDATGQLWAKNALVGKVGSVFASSGHPARRPGIDDPELPHHPAPSGDGHRRSSLRVRGQTRIDEITGGSPYGASTIVGAKGERMPSENELAAARYQGKHVATIAAKLAAK